MVNVSVIIPTYNRGNMIADAINSVLEQTYKDCEVIVIDDGSTDNTKEIISRYGDKVRYFYQQRGGAGSARNYGVSVSQGTYLAFLDSDDIWMKNKLEMQMEIIKNNPELILVYSDCIVTKNGTLVAYYSNWFKPKLGSVYEDLIKGPFIPNLTVVVKKSIVLQVGGFDERLKMSQDYDLYLRVCMKGPVGYVSDQLAEYRLHESNNTKDLYKHLQYDIQLLENHLDIAPQNAKHLIKKRLATLYRYGFIGGIKRMDIGRVFKYTVKMIASLLLLFEYESKRVNIS